MSVGEERRPLIPRPGAGRRMLSLWQGVAFLPVLLVTWSSAAFIISYVIAVLCGHVQPVFPYIRVHEIHLRMAEIRRFGFNPMPVNSEIIGNLGLLVRRGKLQVLQIGSELLLAKGDTGATPPESGIFGFMINVSAFLGAATMYIRYLILKQQNETTNFINHRFNVLVLFVGLVGCIGMSIVANFQELAVPSVHDGGALVAFIFGVLYITLQTIISFKSSPQWITQFTCRIRLAISLINWVAVILMIVFAAMISINKLDWDPDEKDYDYHLVSAICEWIVAFGFVFYFLTFIKDFQGVSIRISTEMTENL